MKVEYSGHIFEMQRYGGISRYFIETGRRLVENHGIDLDFDTRYYINEYLGEKRSHESWERGKEGFVKGLNALKRRHVLGNKMYRYAKHIRKEIDIYHLTYYQSNTRRKNSKKTVVTVYDMVHELFPECFMKSDQTAAAKRNAITRSDHIIAISENTKWDLVRLLGLNPEKISVITLGVTDEVRILEPEIRVDDCQSKSRYLLYVGKRGGYKNFRRFAESYAMSGVKEEVRVVVFGGGRFDTYEKQWLRELGIDRYVEYAGEEDDSLSSLYEQAEAMVYPSLYEGFGIPPLEAMKNSCAVLASNTSSIPEVVGDAALLFDPYSVEEITSAIRQVTYSASVRRELVSRGQKRVKEFSWEKTAKQTAEIYEEVLGR